MFLIVYFSLHFEAFESFQRLVLSSFDDEINIQGSVHHILTRPDTRLPKSRAGGQGLYLRSLDHLGRSSGVKKIKS